VGDESFFLEWIRAFLTNPEKAALLLVIVVGAWRWIREIIRELRGAEREETMLELLIRENRELREELRKDREDDHE
jgi:flagellar biosynthesis/type III secretory pathway M-ring protein FliF/YscJ